MDNYYILIALISNYRWYDANLIPSSHMVRHVLEAAHHPLIPEVVWKRLGPLRQQLHQLGGHLTETDLKTITWRTK